MESDDYFERLCLDRLQPKMLTPDVAKMNYAILSDFWKEKLWLLEGQDRGRIAKKYSAGDAGEVRQHERDLEVAFDRLDTGRHRRGA